MRILFFRMTAESCALLSAINTLCKGGGFTVVEEHELASALPEGASLRPRLEELSERRLIEIRYAEEGTYCIRVLAAGREYLPRLKQDAKEAALERTRVALCAALGGALGGMFSVLVFAALLL